MEISPEHLQAVNAVSGRMSLRLPQKESLQMLARLCEILPLDKEADVAAALEAVRREFPTLKDFDREFPSFCFSIATGVGKTRLMGAFIAYLYRTEGMRNFFIVAPNLTIYEKLVRDFSPAYEKYVLKGIGEFATVPPEIVTGDNYESGRALRGKVEGQAVLPGQDVCQINIFNISKLNEKTGGQARIRRLNEVLGKSYFDYLASLDDLVVIMDESHRYRALAGAKSINDLRPILGLELTATPQVEKGGKDPIPFSNVVYDYPLAKALKDGFVKEPAVVTRTDFDPKKHSEKTLQELKLQDAAIMHERTKAALAVYSRETDRPLVKPFVLVVTEDKAHAADVESFLESPAFRKGEYKGKVRRVHSGMSGDEEEQMVKDLMEVEKTSNPIEWVVHVNKLKEGWDVTNLYTIVPLRAANSRTLVEQSIGRGLRLPYGRRTGEDSVDTLSIISHDRFQEIVDYAKKPDSVIRKSYIIGKDIPVEPPKKIEARSRVEEAILAGKPTAFGEKGDWKEVLATPQAQEAALATVEAIREVNPTTQVASLDDALNQPTIHAQIVQKVAAKMPDMPIEAVREVVNATSRLHAEDYIDLPKIRFDYSEVVTSDIKPFKVDMTGIRPQPLSEDLYLKFLREERGSIRFAARLHSEDEEPRLENYIIRELVLFNEINYDDQADLLNDLATQVVNHVRSYIDEPTQLENALRVNANDIAQSLRSQILKHMRTKQGEPKATALRGFQTIHARTFSIDARGEAQDFRIPVADRSYIRGMVFNGFKRSLFPLVKFDSDPERRLAVVLEDDAAVQRWFKPSRNDLQIEYRPDDSYTPDFIVEGKAAKYLIEVKANNELQDPDVQAKAKRAVDWCRQASAYEAGHGGKAWEYLLVPEDAARDNATLNGLVRQFGISKGTEA